MHYKLIKRTLKLHLIPVASKGACRFGSALLEWTDFTLAAALGAGHVLG